MLALEEETANQAAVGSIVRLQFLINHVAGSQLEVVKTTHSRRLKVGIMLPTHWHIFTTHFLRRSDAENV